MLPFGKVLREIAFKSILNNLHQRHRRIRLLNVISTGRKIFFCRKLLIDNFILIADLVIQNLLSIGIHTRHNLCFHIDLRIVRNQLILFFLFHYLFLDFFQLNLLTGSLLHNFERNEVCIGFQCGQFGTPDIIIDVYLIGSFVLHFYISKFKLILVIQHINSIFEFQVLCVPETFRFPGRHFQSDRRQLLESNIQHIA